MSASQRRREQRERKAARIEAGTWVAKPPVGKLRLLHRTPERTQGYMLAELTRGKRRAPKIHNVAVSD